MWTAAATATHDKDEVKEKEGRDTADPSAPSLPDLAPTTTNHTQQHPDPLPSFLPDPTTPTTNHTHKHPPQREFIGSKLLAFARAHEHVTVKTELKRNAHPFVRAEYGAFFPALFCSFARCWLCVGRLLRLGGGVCGSV